MGKSTILIIESSLRWQVIWKKDLESVGHECIVVSTKMELSTLADNLPTSGIHLILFGDIVSGNNSAETEIFSFLKSLKVKPVIISSSSDEERNKKRLPADCVVAVHKHAAPFFVAGYLFARTQPRS